MDNQFLSFLCSVNNHNRLDFVKYLNDLFKFGSIKIQDVGLLCEKFSLCFHPDLWFFEL